MSVYEVLCEAPEFYAEFIVSIKAESPNDAINKVEELHPSWDILQAVKDHSIL